MTTECYVTNCTNLSTTARMYNLNGHLFLSIPTLLCDHHAEVYEHIHKDLYVHITLEEYKVLKIKASL